MHKTGQISGCNLALYIDNNDNKMTFLGNIVYFRPCSVICVPRCARAANDITRAQINNIPSKSHAIPLLNALPDPCEGEAHNIPMRRLIMITPWTSYETSLRCFNFKVGGDKL